MIVFKLQNKVWYPGMLCALLLFVLPKYSMAQQDVQFSQYIFNGLALNPGYAGYKEQTNLDVMYRNQWTGLDGAPKTFSALLDGVSANNSHGFGFQVLNDQLGAENNTSAVASYAYRLKLSERSRLSFGVSAGLQQYSIDWNKLTETENDLNRPAGNTSVPRPLMNFGLFYASDKSFYGLSVTNFLSNYYNDASNLYLSRSRYYYAQAGTLIGISEELSLKPSFLIREDFKGPTNIDLNLLLVVDKKLTFGGSYRTGMKIFKKTNLQQNLSENNAISVMFSLQLKKNLRLGYAYDYSVNHMNSVSNGSHEISLGYLFNRKNAPVLTPRNL